MKWDAEDAKQSEDNPTGDVTITSNLSVSHNEEGTMEIQGIDRNILDKTRNDEEVLVQKVLWTPTY